MYNFDIKRLVPTIYVLSVIILLFIVFKLMIFFLPFVFSTAIIFILRPIMKKLITYTKIKDKLVKNTILFLFYLLIMGVVLYVSVRTISQLLNLSNNLIENKDIIERNVENIIKQGENYFSLLPEYVIKLSNDLIVKALNTVSSRLVNIINSGFNIILKLPRIIVFIFIMIISSFLMINDEKKIVEFVKKQVPNSWLKIAKDIKIDVIKLVFNFFKAQLLLIILCFVELLIGLTIINIYTDSINYVLVISLFAAIVDALPILGIGSVLIPWSIISIIAGDYKLGLCILVLYFIIFIIRQYTEPKLISNSSNMHPLVTLVAMYGGYKIFGVLGFLYGPIILTVFRIVFSQEIEYGFFKYLINERVDDETNTK